MDQQLQVSTKALVSNGSTDLSSPFCAPLIYLQWKDGGVKMEGHEKGVKDLDSSDGGWCAMLGSSLAAGQS